MITRYDHKTAPELAFVSPIGHRTSTARWSEVTISIEPGIYLRDVGGFRHSDTVLVTKDGFESLTKAPDSLDDLVLRGWRLASRGKDRLVRRALGLPPPGHRVDHEGA